MKKLLKRLLIGSISFFSIFFIVSCSAKNNETTNLDFYLSSDGTYGVSAGDSKDLKEINIPSIHNGEPVTIISNFGFSGCTNLTSIKIPNSITIIDNNAFMGCENLTSIEIPESVTSIGKSAFSFCSNLNFNEYNNGLYLGNNENPYLALIDVNDRNVNSFEINQQTKIISEYAFLDYNNLTSITIPNGIKTIPGYIFSSCKNLNYNEYNNGLYLGNSNNPYLILRGMKDKIVTSFDIHKQTKIIVDSAFYNCSNLTNVTIPEGVESIGYFGFYNCSSLESISIPNTVTIIGELAFSNCSNLKTITMSNNVKRIDISTFYECSNLAKVYYKGKSPYSDVIKYIGFNNQNLTNAAWYYFTSNGSSETASGNWWYYDTDGVTIIEKIVA